MYTISLARKCAAKSTTAPCLFDATPEALDWRPVDASSPAQFAHADLILDPVNKLRGAFGDLGFTDELVVLRSPDLSKVRECYDEFDHVQLPLPTAAADKTNMQALSADLLADLEKMATYTQTAISVSTDFVLHIYGVQSNVAYCRYKVQILLSHFEGYSIHRIEVPYSMHPIISGRARTNLKTLYDHTGVNVYMPPSDPPERVFVDEIYLVGNKAQVLMAAELLQNAVISRVMQTPSVLRQVEISPHVCDTINTRLQEEVCEIMIKHGTFVQLPPFGMRGHLKYSVLGCSKCDVDSTVDAVEKLCSMVYVAEFAAVSVEDQVRFSLYSRASSYNSNTTQIYGLGSELKSALQQLSDETEISVYIEQPLDLLDFILGKKQGKMSKVVNDTGTVISTEKLDAQSFRLKLSGQTSGSTQRALDLLEDELPAEAILHIPEVFHKQVIGQGGQTIQKLMRKYNVYMRFENTARERSPNQLGNSQPENVLIRCPTKNKQQIASAAHELLQFVVELDRAHVRLELVLPRSDRRLLLAMRSGLIREVEMANNVAIKLPSSESAEDQTLVVSGQSEEAVAAAQAMLKQHLESTNYEFRTPWSPRFSDVVGSCSTFAVDVVAPLYLKLGAEVQTFDEVRMADDDGVYSQITVSMLDHPDSFGLVSEVITRYLRLHKLDIVDCGELTTNTFATKLPPQQPVKSVLAALNEKQLAVPSPTASGALQPAAFAAVPLRATQGVGGSLARYGAYDETPIKRRVDGRESENTLQPEAFMQPQLHLKPRRAATKFNRLF